VPISQPKEQLKVIYSKYSSRAVFLLASLPLVLTAQRAQESVVPLKNWATPLYWQPNQEESKARQGLTPLGGGGSPPAPEPTFLTFVAMTPCRLVDTRGNAQGFYGPVPFEGPSIQPGLPATFLVQSPAAASTTAPAPCPAIPSTAAAYSINLTVIPQAGQVGGAVNYVQIWPAGAPQPYVANLTDLEGVIISNAVIVAAGTPYGGISLFNFGPATIDAVIDVNGYFTSPTDLNGNTALGTGTLASNTSGVDNTATGDDALQGNLGGSYNTANGYQALQTNAGSQNTAIGYGALTNNAGNDNTATGAGALNSNNGSFNTANGAQALASNTSGSANTASGRAALASNTQGGGNTATGNQAMASNIDGNNNTATGTSALQVNTIGSFNTATGVAALQYNTENNNTANGYGALNANTVGKTNTASGYQALTNNLGGSSNTAFGGYALLNNAGGANNIAIGFYSGVSQPIGNNDSIYLGATGTAADVGGSIFIGTQAAEATGTIQIGLNQTGGTSIAGIYQGIPNASNLPVCVDSNGVIGTAGCNIALNGPCPPDCPLLRTPSSLRFKDQIADMGDSSDKLLQLRPVTFLYKPQYDDGSHALQYGLIAEEVAKLYPEMVGYDKAGQPSSVNYQSLAPMLLNELQKQAEQVRSLEERLAALEESLTVPDPVR
jgi:hypothetical protein